MVSPALTSSYRMQVLAPYSRQIHAVDLRDAIIELYNQMAVGLRNQRIKLHDSRQFVSRNLFILL